MRVALWEVRLLVTTVALIFVALELGQLLLAGSP